MKYKIPQTALVVLLLVAAGCGKGGDNSAKGDDKGAKAAPGQPAATAATPVRVSAATRQVVSRAIPVTGSIMALQTVDLSPKVSARISTVLGREGTVVHRNQTVIQQDTTDLQIAVDQARANLEATQASLQSARVKLRQSITQADLQVTNSSTGVQDAQQQLASARAQLDLAKRPQRAEEVAVSNNSVAQAQANYVKALSDRQRYEALVKEGAAAQITLDQYVNQERVAAAALDSAKQQQQISRTGGREESIRQAQTAVRRAEVALRLAKANTQQNAVKQDDIQASRAQIQQLQAQVSQLRAALEAAQVQLSYASIRSPIEGVISSRSTEPGQQAAPGQTIMQIVALDTVYFEAQVPETDIASIQVGLPVAVRVDAYPGRTFNGSVAKVYPTANTTSRAFAVRIEVPNNDRRLRPGTYARGSVVAERRQGIVISKDALLSEDGKFYVFVAENSAKAVRRPIKVGIVNDRTAEIKSGIQVGDQVIVVGQDALKDGAAIQIKNNDAEPEHSASL